MKDLSTIDVTESIGGNNFMRYKMNKVSQCE